MIDDLDLDLEGETTEETDEIDVSGLIVEELARRKARGRVR